jgi:hypothetical protein
LIADGRKLSMLRNATWTLSNFCRGKTPQPDWPTVSDITECRKNPLANKRAIRSSLRCQSWPSLSTC